MTIESPARTTPYRTIVLVVFAAAVVLLLPLGLRLPGLVAWAVAVALVAFSRDGALHLHMGILLGVVLMLSYAPINTDLSPRHFVTLGIPFFLALAVPAAILKWKSPGTMDWRFFPKKLHKRDIIYTLIAIPGSWAIIWLYFFHLSPELPTHWPLPHPRDPDVVQRFIIGINCVGIWDELFFINTVYVLLRPLYPKRIANLGQAVVYTSVLYTMAFTGWGPVIIYLFALTQGIMFERARALVWVLLVHIIVDVFLVLAILHYHYPGGGLLI